MLAGRVPTAGARRADLERDPRRVDLGRLRGHGRRPGPDVREPSPPGGKVHHGRRQGAAVLVAGHDEVVHDEGREQQQEDDARQGKPVHLPVGPMDGSRSRGLPGPLTSHVGHRAPRGQQPAAPERRLSARRAKAPTA